MAIIEPFASFPNSRKQGNPISEALKRAAEKIANASKQGQVKKTKGPGERFVHAQRGGENFVRQGTVNTTPPVRQGNVTVTPPQPSVRINDARIVPPVGGPLSRLPDAVEATKPSFKDNLFNTIRLRQGQQNNLPVGGGSGVFQTPSTSQGGGSLPAPASPSTGGTFTTPENIFDPGAQSQNPLDFTPEAVNSEDIAAEVARLLDLEFNPRQNELQRTMELIGLTSDKDIDVLQGLMDRAPGIIDAAFQQARSEQEGNRAFFQGALDDARGNIAGFPSQIGGFFSTPNLPGVVPEGRNIVQANLEASQGLAQAGIENQGLVGLSDIARQANDTSTENAFQQGNVISQLLDSISGTQSQAAENRFLTQGQLNDVIEERGLKGTQLALELTRAAEEQNRQAANDLFTQELARQQLALEQQQFDLSRTLGLGNLGLDRAQQQLLERQFGLDLNQAGFNNFLDLLNFGQDQQLIDNERNQGNQPTGLAALDQYLSQSGAPQEAGQVLRHIIGRTAGNPETAQAAVLSLIGNIENEENQQVLRTLGFDVGTPVPGGVPQILLNGQPIALNQILPFLADGLVTYFG